MPYSRAINEPTAVKTAHISNSAPLWSCDGDRATTSATDAIVPALQTATVAGTRRVSAMGTNNNL